MCVLYHVLEVQEVPKFLEEVPTISNSAIHTKRNENTDTFFAGSSNITEAEAIFTMKIKKK